MFVISECTNAIPRFKPWAALSEHAPEGFVKRYFPRFVSFHLFLDERLCPCSFRGILFEPQTEVSSPLVDFSLNPDHNRLICCFWKWTPLIRLPKKTRWTIRWSWSSLSGAVQRALVHDSIGSIDHESQRTSNLIEIFSWELPLWFFCVILLVWNPKKMIDF